MQKSTKVLFWNIFPLQNYANMNQTIAETMGIFVEWYY